MTENEEALLHAGIDGELSIGDRAELEALLQRDEDARRRFASLQRLAGIIEELGSASPPVDFPQAVTNVVWNGNAVRAPRARTLGGGRFMARKVLIGLAAAAALVLVAFAITGYPPVGKGAQGTVGQAQRYQAPTPQMSSTSVKLGDGAAQTFMQTDVFDRLIKDETSRKLLADASVRQALANPAIAQALSDPAVARALSDPALAKALSNDAVAKAFSNDALVRALSDGAAARAVSDPALAQILQNGALAQALKNDALVNALKVDAVRSALAASALQQALASGALQSALQSQAFVNALRSDGFAVAAQSAQFAAALAR